MNTPSPRILPPLADVTVTALGGLGDGLSELDGKPLFVEKSSAGDRLRVRIVHETKEHARGEIIEILEAGPERITAPCPHFFTCGGCNLQQLSESSYQALKRTMLGNALHHGGFGDVKSDIIFLPAASRRRVEFKFDGNRLAYYAPRSRVLVPVDSCLILEPALQALMEPLAKALGAWHAARAIKTVSLTAADSGIDMVLECSSLVHDTAHLSALADALDIARISIAVAEQKTTTVVNRAPVVMQLGGYDVALPAGAFLQATREGQRLITEAVVSALIPPPVGGRLGGGQSCSERTNNAPLPASPLRGEELRVADLFSGIGTYSFSLSRHIKCHGVESDTSMVKSLKTMIHLHGLQRTMSAAVRDLFAAPLSAKELAGYDAVILNPPRPGAKAQCEEIAKSAIKKLVMVSCNPASFARDAKILKNAGFSLLSAQGIDQFVYSSHLEIVAVFRRDNEMIR